MRTVAQLIRARRSIRAFTSDDIPKNEIMGIIKAGTLAPSAGNMQSWEFVLVRDDVQKDGLANAALSASKNYI